MRSEVNRLIRRSHDDMRRPFLFETMGIAAESPRTPTHRSAWTRCSLSILACLWAALAILPRHATAANVSWDGGGDGVSWSDPANWSTDLVPGALDNVTIDTAAEPTIQVTNINVTIQGLVAREVMRFADSTFAVNGIFEFRDKTLRLESGLLLAFSIQSSNATVRYMGGDLFTAVFIHNGTLEMAGGTNFADFILEGMCALSGALVLGQSVTVRGLDGGTTIATAPLGFTSGGLIRLESTPGALTTMFRVNQGALAIEPDGLLLLEPGGGSHIIDATLDNRGMLVVNADFDLTGSLTNAGTIQLAPAVALDLAIHPGKVFRQTAGQLLVPADASVHLRNDNKDSVPLAAVHLAGGSVEAPLIDLENLGLTLSGSQVSGDVTLRLRGDKSTLQGDIRNGQTVWIHAESPSPTLVTAFGVLTNQGTLRLHNGSPTNQALLRINGGHLRNEPTGTVEFLPGAGGSLVVDASIDNQGLLLSGAPFDFTGSITNTGTFRAAAGTDSSLSLRAGQQFLQTTGTIEIPADATLRMVNGDKGFIPQAALLLQGGSVSGAGFIVENISLHLGGSAVAGTFSIAMEDDLNGLTGPIGPNQTLWIRGTALGPGVLRSLGSVTNAGTLRLENIDPLNGALLALNTGAIENLAGGVLDILPGAGGTRAIQADIHNQGTLRVQAGFSLTGSLANTGQVQVLPAVDAVINLEPGRFFRQTGGLVAVPPSSTLRLRSSLPNSVPLGAVLLEGGTVDAAEIILENITASLLGPQVGGAFKLAFEQEKNSLAGAIAPGQTVLIRGASVGHALVNTLGSLTNAGTLLFENVAPATVGLLRVNGGHLRNETAGLVRFAPGPGGLSSMEADVDNRGAWQADTSFGLTGTFTNTGTFAVPAGADVTLGIQPGRQFIQLGGLLACDPAGHLRIRSAIESSLPLGVVRLHGGSVQVNPLVLENIFLTLDGPSVAGPFTLVFEDDKNALTGQIAADQTLWIRGSTNGNALLSYAGLLVNQGTLRLENNGPGRESRLTLNTGFVQNSPTGRILFNEGAGGTRVINATVDNAGNIQVNADFDLSANLTNRGVFRVETNVALTVSLGAGRVFTQPAGMLVVAPGASARLRSENKLALPLPIVSFTGGELSAEELIVESVALTLDGPALGGDFRIAVENDRNSLLGALAAGQTLLVRGTTNAPALSTFLTAAPHEGTLRLETLSPLNESRIRMNSIPLLIGPGGRLEIGEGLGPNLAIEGHISNKGQVHAEIGFTPGGTFTNDGLFAVAPGKSVVLPIGAAQAFRQNIGSIQVPTTASFRLKSANKNAQPLATVQLLGGSMDAELVSESTGLTLLGSQVTGTFGISVENNVNSFTGTVEPGQTLRLRGQPAMPAQLYFFSSFTNNGTIRLEGTAPGTSSDLILNAGPLVNGPQGTVASIGGTASERRLTGTLENRGLLQLDSSVLTYSGAPIVNQPGAILAGSGTLNLGGASLQNHGILRPGLPLGVLRVQGPVANSPSARLEVDVAGTTPGIDMDQLQVTGASDTKGSFLVTALNDFVPVAGQEFPVFTYASRQGQYLSLEGLVVTESVGFETLYQPTAFRLRAVDLPGSPPQVTLQPVGGVLSAGQNITLEVLATGPPPITYQWRRNGVNIPGATSPILTLTNNQPMDGGTYRVVVANDAGAVKSNPVTVTVSTPALIVGDAFSLAGTLIGPSGLGSANNSAATLEPGEPLHDGKAGGRSVWVKWTASFNGVAVFNTAGSTFDTLLAVYQGTTVSNLTRIASSDEGGGFRNSRLTFNAGAGQTYRIAIDGYQGASGPFLLNWSLTFGAPALPVLQSTPTDVVTNEGAAVTFSVSATGPAPLAYQWSRNGLDLPGATHPSLLLPALTPQEAGFYQVRVTGSTGGVIDSLPAALELSSRSAPPTADKLEDLIGATPPMDLAPGASIRNIFRNDSTDTQEDEPLHDGRIGGSTRWFGPFLATGSGDVFLNTVGSDVDTIVAVYTGDRFSNLSVVASDDNGAADGVRSQLQFALNAGTRYVVAVDGIGGDRGMIHLNWGGGIAPQPTGPIPPVAVLRGGRVVLPAMMAPGQPAGTYQWYRDNIPIAGATGPTLTLPAVMTDDDYEVRVTNPHGTAVNQADIIVVEGVLSVPGGDGGGGGPGFTFTGTASGPILIEATSDFLQWSPVHTNTLPGVPFEFQDPQAAILPARFYRFLPW